MCSKIYFIYINRIIGHKAYYLLFIQLGLHRLLILLTFYILTSPLPSASALNAVVPLLMRELALVAFLLLAIRVFRAECTPRPELLCPWACAACSSASCSRVRVRVRV